jgi:hypothetical protein
MNDVSTHHNCGACASLFEPLDGLRAARSLAVRCPDPATRDSRASRSARFSSFGGIEVSPALLPVSKKWSI